MRARLIAHSRWLNICTAVVWVLLIGWVDVQVGPELSFTILLLLPVMLGATSSSRWERLIVCAVSGAAWFFIDMWTQRSSMGGMAFWNGLLRFGVLLLVNELTARVAAQNVLLAKEVGEREAVEERLRKVNETLQQTVAERTAAVERRSAELLQSETALREQVEILQSILRYMKDGLIVVDGRGQVVLCNPEAARLVGSQYSNGAKLDWPKRKVSPALTESRPALEGEAHPILQDLPFLHQAMLHGEAVLDIQARFQSGEGTDHTAIWSAAPIRGPDGAVAGAVAVGRDITELKRTEADLIRSNVELEKREQERSVTLAQRAALLELSFDGIIVRDMEGHVQYWNRGAEEMYGWQRAEATGQVTHQLFQTEFPKPLPEIQEELTQSGRWSGELIHRRRDGKRLVVATRWALQIDPTGVPRSVLETNSDITERKETEEAKRRRLEEMVAERTVTLEKRTAELAQSEADLREQADVLQSILNSMGDGVIVADASGLISLCNPEAERLLELDGSRVRLQDWLTHHQTWFSAAVEPDQNGEHPFLRGLRGERIDAPEMYVESKNTGGGWWVSVKARPLIDERNQLRGTVIVLSDVTVRKTLENQVAKISEREQRRIGQDLHDGVCQQLVSTAYACNMLAETLADKGAPESAQAVEIYSLLKDAIIEARTLARALHPADLTGEGLSLALEELAQRVQDSTGICCVFTCDSAAFVQDQSVGTHLYRIAQEAVNNAVKHSRAALIQLDLLLEGDRLVLRIKDNGEGIRSGVQDRQGIGLNTMSYRARMIGASLFIGPGDGKGTLISCSLRQPSF